MSSVNEQLTILTASKSRVYNGSEQAQDIRQLRKEMDALRHRVVELEQGEEEHNRNYASARHMAALFEEYVSTATEEATAMLKSHETLKQQVESSEKLISILAEKIVTMVGTQANKVKEFEEIQVGHQTKIIDIDQKQKELTHKVNQLKHNEKQVRRHCTARSVSTCLLCGHSNSSFDPLAPPLLTLAAEPESYAQESQSHPNHRPRRGLWRRWGRRRRGNALRRGLPRFGRRDQVGPFGEHGAEHGVNPSGNF